MAIYVDGERNVFRGMKMCHMIADSLAELHDMAQYLGLKPAWFQNHKTPHYDICQSKRRLAIKNGALELDRRGFVAAARGIRNNAHQ